MFPSPCGVWVVSDLVAFLPGWEQFPSPCGVWVVSSGNAYVSRGRNVSVPLRGVGCFVLGRGLRRGAAVSVPLRGVGCFQNRRSRTRTERVSVPLRGVGCFRDGADRPQMVCVSVPLRGVGCFRQGAASATGYQGFPSPCGVWVVSPTASCADGAISFRPLAGCGLFRQSCTFFLVQQEKELSTLLFYCIILADVYQ